MDRAKTLIAVGTSPANLDSRWVRYEWDSFFNDILSGVKPDGRVFVYAVDLDVHALPRALRQTQCITHEKDSLERLFRFVSNALAALPRGKRPRHEPGPERDLLRVAISGSLHTESNDWSEFCRRLGERLAQAGHAILATNAKHVGRAFYRGACEALFDKGEDIAASRCRLMQLVSLDKRRRHALRETFLRGVGITVLVGGSGGTREEYEIAVANGAFVIPIGASGGTAGAVWRELRAEYHMRLSQEAFEAFLALNDRNRTKDEILQCALRLVELRFAQSAS